MSKKAEKLFKKAEKYRNNGQEEKAREKYFKAAGIFEEEENLERLSDTYQHIGVCYKIENNEEKAVEWLKKAAKLAERIGYTDGVGWSYRDIGLALAYKGKHEEALSWLEKSVDKLDQAGNREHLGITIAKVGAQQMYLGEYEESEKNIREGLAMLREEKNWFFEMTAVMHLADLYFHKEEFERALGLFWCALGMIYENGDYKAQTRRLSQLYAAIAMCYDRVGNEDYAKKYMESSEEFLNKMPDDVSEVVRGEIKERGGEQF